MTDDALIEAMARAACAAVEENPDEICGVDKRPAWTFLLDEMKAALAVCRPIIEAQERERCAVQADAFHSLHFDVTVSDEYAAGFFTACNEIAAAIRSHNDD